MLRTAVTEYGEVRGIPSADPRITAFRGIPFAAPPTGKNRWRAPQPAEKWEGIKDCARFAPISVQDTPGTGDGLYDREWHVDPEIPMDEDCLYLNVWTGAKKTDEKLPVLVWFFGGGFQWGYTAEMEFDGERLARRGLIVVTVNYRLGALGFMAHADITKEAPEAPGNFGLLDQQAGLRWVKNNIAAFGGDPDRITIAGQSAGGGSTMQQLVANVNRDIVKGAVVLSGMIRNPERDKDFFKPKTLAEAEKLGAEFFEFLGVKSLDEARALDPFTIRDKYAKFRETHHMMVPIIDGVFSTGDAMERFENGDRAQVPVISGYTADEFIFDGINTVERSVKGAFLSAKEKGDKNNLYCYCFTPEIPGWDHPGCFHSCDLWFFFETISKCWRPYTGRHYELAEKMCDYFANFIKTGDPNGMGSDGLKLPEWRPFEPDDRVEMMFKTEGPELTPDAAGDGRKQGLNPYLPSWEYIPDGEPYVFGDRVYVYGSHDLYNGQTFCLGDYVCWSAPVNDLGNWRYEGVIYEKTADPLNKSGEMCLYAPDVTVGPDGRYYLFYVLDKVSVVSVAVCDQPAGRYEFLGYVHYPDGTRLGDKEGDEPQFDPGVLTEGGLTYMFTGFAPKEDKGRHGSMLTVLDSDMLTIKKGPEFIAPGGAYSEGTGFEGHAFFEASSIRKRGDIYYFIYSSEVMHELCYATSDSPEGPFRYGGVIVSNCDIGIDSYKPAEMPMAYGANNHGSMVQIGDDWYIFYHRHTNGTWFSRQGCAEKLTFREDGSIVQAMMTSCGLNGGPLSDTGTYPTYIACNIFTDKHAMYVESDTPRVIQDGGDGDRNTGYVAGIRDKAVLGFKSFDMKGVKGLKIYTRGYLNGSFEIRTAWDGPVLGTIEVKSANIWTEFRGDFAPEDGVNDLYLTFSGSGGGSIKSFEFLH